MRGSQKVIDELNKLLTGELTAMDMYFIYTKMLQDWGMDEVAKRFRHELDDELGHADRIMDRILFLEGTPDVATRQGFKVEMNIKSIFTMLLDDEINVAANLKNAIVTCELEKDFATRSLLLDLLRDTEEDHIKWIEIQLKLIEKIGEKNYIQSSMSQ